MNRFSGTGRLRVRASALTVLATAALLVTASAQAAAATGPAALDTVRAALAGRLVPNTAVGVEPASRQVVLTVADAAAGTSRLLAAAKAYGSAVRVEHVPGSFGTFEGHIQGGHGIVTTDGAFICSLGFNTTGGFALTAGHCGRVGQAWNKENNGLYIGPTVMWSFPGADWAKIRNDGPMTQWGSIQGYDAGVITVTGTANAYAGESVCKSGRTTQRTCGSVLRTGVSILYSGETSPVDNLIETNACAGPGDSGGSLYDGGTAIGLVSGGTLGISCGSSSFRSYHYPVTIALAAAGVGILTG